MANLDLYPPEGEAQPTVAQMDLVFTAGSAGAIPSSLTVSRGIKSVAYSTNAIVITLDNGWDQLLNVNATNLQATPAAGGACIMALEGSANFGGSASAPTITIQGRSGDGTYTAVKLANGDIFRCTIRVQANKGILS